MKFLDVILDLVNMQGKKQSEEVLI